MFFLQHGFEKWEESQIVIFNLKITNSNPEALGLKSDSKTKVKFYSFKNSYS
jgi:hypothetical protein